MSAYFIKDTILPRVIIGGFTNLYADNAVIGELVLERANVVDIHGSLLDTLETEKDGQVNNLWIDESKIYEKLEISKTNALQLAIHNSYVRNVHIRDSTFKHMHFRNMRKPKIDFRQVKVANDVTLYNTLPKRWDADSASDYQIDMR